MTDWASWYKYLSRDGEFASHDRVDHMREEYVRRDGESRHTNTVEGYYSIFKRGMKGVYQHCTEKHLHRYLRSSISATAIASPLALTTWRVLIAPSRASSASG